MTRLHNSSVVYRITSSLAVGGLIIALALQPARAESVGDELAASLESVLVEQGNAAMQNIAQELMADSDWAGTAKAMLEQIRIEDDAEPAKGEENSDAKIAGH